MAKRQGHTDSSRAITSISLHQNEFIVESINGLEVSIDPNKSEVGDAYIGDSLVDVYQMGPAYAKEVQRPTTGWNTNDTGRRWKLC